MVRQIFFFFYCAVSLSWTVFFYRVNRAVRPTRSFFSFFFCVSLSVCATREIPNEDRHYGGPFLFDQRPPSLTIFGPFRSRNATLISQTTGRVSVSLISDVIGRFVFSPVLRHVHRETVGFCYLTASRNGRSKSRTSLQTSCRSNHQSGEPTTKLRRARPRGRVGCCGKKKSPSFMFCLMEAVEDAAVRSAAVSCSDCIGSLKKVSVCFCFFLLSQIKFEVGISSVIFKRNASLFLGLAKARRIDSHFQCGKRNSALHFLFYQLAHGGCRGSSFFSVGVY